MITAGENTILDIHSVTNRVYTGAQKKIRPFSERVLYSASVQCCQKKHSHQISTKRQVCLSKRICFKKGVVLRTRMVPLLVAVASPSRCTKLASCKISSVPLTSTLKETSTKSPGLMVKVVPESIESEQPRFEMEIKHA